MLRTRLGGNRSRSLCHGVWRRQTLGTITGDAKDASGAVIPGAKATAQNVANQCGRTQQTNEVGRLPSRRCRQARTSSKLSCKASSRRRTVWNFTSRRPSASISRSISAA